MGLYRLVVYIYGRILFISSFSQRTEMELFRAVAGCSMRQNAILPCLTYFRLECYFFLGANQKRAVIWFFLGQVLSAERTWKLC